MALYLKRNSAIVAGFGNFDIFQLKSFYSLILMMFYPKQYHRTLIKFIILQFVKVYIIITCQVAGLIFSQMRTLFSTTSESFTIYKFDFNNKIIGCVSKFIVTRRPLISN